ncbi:hypothetical protein [Cupriavidus taiwanensis]|uniref:hypothetical protein n=1 Tax=Cupriavidus taiwanensis TaxID=164546 RepID=UPI0015594211|nr:hypothetical protein [Cupriavidus taiwanensis]
MRNTLQWRGSRNPLTRRHGFAQALPALMENYSTIAPAAYRVQAARKPTNRGIWTLNQHELLRAAPSPAAQAPADPACGRQAADSQTDGSGMVLAMDAV